MTEPTKLLHRLFSDEPAAANNDNLHMNLLLCSPYVVLMMSKPIERWKALDKSSMEVP
jgi:hypothetical protein